MTVRRVVAGIGRGLILLGVLILLFVAYQLWGTGLHESRAQNDLQEQFEVKLRNAKPRKQGLPPAPEIPETGDVIAHIRIPAIGVSKYVVEGVTIDDLKNGPGHYIETPMPGQKGNAAIAGHRTTYGAPFFDLNELKPGDPIYVTTVQGRFTYRFRKHLVVAPTAIEVLDATKDNRLTLTTCNPRYSAAERLVAIADLEGKTVESPPPRARPRRAEPIPTATDTLDLSGDPTARAPAIMWGSFAALVLLCTWAAGRWWRRWPAWLLGTPAFLVVLFFFFENFARLLPPNV